MKPAQKSSKAWQDYCAGRLKTPQDLYAAYMAELEAPEGRFLSMPEDTDIFDAPQRLRAPAHFHSNGWLRQSERADWAHVDPRLAYWAACFVEAGRKRGVPLYVHTALRDKAEQDRLNKLGHSKAAYPLSAHNIGEAVDIVHGVFHWEMTRDEWKYLHVLGERVLERVNAPLRKADKLALTWGGDFKSLYDPAHWEISDFRARRRPLAAVVPRHIMPNVILENYRRTDGGAI